MSGCPHCGTENPSVAAFCMSCGTRLLAPTSRGDVRKSVTIVFCDVTGSTALAERLDPEAVRRVMSRYFEAMQSALERHGGIVEKFIGDAVMAVFGLPQAHEDDALRAVRAASEMQLEVLRLGDELRADLDVEFSARIGVNTGEVIAGDSSARQAMVTGDAVNVAARLEQKAQPGEVLLGAATYRLVRNVVKAELTGPLELKGKSAPIEAYRLVEVPASTLDSTTQSGARLIGRKEDLQVLRTALERAITQRQCQSVTVTAPAGTGKSRLVEEFLDELAPPARWLKGRCLPYGEGITYFPVTQVVRQAAGLAEFDHPDEVERRVLAILSEEEHQVLVSGRILQLLGVGDAGSPEDTLWAVRRFVEAVARQQPLVLVIEDLHWAEPRLLDLVEHIAEWSQDVPLMLLGTARPEFLELRPGWARHGSTSGLLILEPLDPSQCEALISELLGGTAVPEAVAQRVTQAAGGTPLFVEEMVAMLVDDGLLGRTADGWALAGDLAAIGPPPTISALLAARLDRLSENERRVLDAGAVVGQEFLVGAIRELVPQDLRPVALTHLMAMVRKELLRPDASSTPGKDAFRFRHELVRDAAYDALPKRLRGELHELVAAWMERIAGDRIAEQEEIIGYHLEQAHRYRTELSPHDPVAPTLALRAGRALVASGRRAWQRGDIRATANLLDRAGRLLPADDRELLELVPALAECFDEMGDSDGAERVLQGGLAAARQLGDQRLHARLTLAALEYGADALGETMKEWADRAATQANASLAIFEQAGDLVGAAAARRLLGFGRWSRGAASEAIQHWEHSADMAARAGDPSQAAHDRAWILVGHYFSQTPASQLLHNALEALSTFDDVPAAKAEALWTVSGCWAMLGDFEQSRSALVESDRIEAALGRAETANHYGPQVMGQAQGFCGLLHDRVETLRRGVAESEALGKRANPLLRALLAEAHVEVGADEEAWLVAQSVREAVASRDGAKDQAAVSLDVMFTSTLRAEALVLARRRDDATALARAREALGLLGQTDFYWLTADALMTLADVHRLAGRRSEAADAAAQALERYEHKEIRRLANLARRFESQLRK